MANPGVGNKFVSVNLNKSYGQQQYHQHHHNTQHHSSSYGSNRNRPFGGGGGMVVLSRPRSLQKASRPKLSIPPPLNLPSLRKEHEKFDSVGSGGGPAGGGLGGGPRPSSSGMGWTKPVAIAIQEKEVSDDQTVDNSSNSQVSNQGSLGVVNGVSKGTGSSLYTPPSARTVIPAVSVPSRGHPVMERAAVFRGEDFPSLKASLPANSGPEKKQKDGMHQKSKQLPDELVNERGNTSHLSTFVDMRPQLHSRSNIVNGLRDSGAESRGSLMSEKHRKQEDLLPGQLPLVRLNPRSDWTDDERDTGLSLTERGRDYGFSKHETFLDMDFDFPRPSILPQKPGHYLFDRRGQQDNETGNISSNEVTKVDNFGRDVKMPSREGVDGSSWRVPSPLSSDRYGVQDDGNEKNGIGMRPSSMNREATKENKYMPSPFRDNSQDAGHALGRHPWNNKMDSFGNRGSDGNNREQFGNGKYNKYRGNTHQSSSLTKSSFSLGGRGPPINDPILNFGRDRRSFSKSEKPYLEDPFMKEYGSAPFDGRDPLFGPLVGILKKKKELFKQTDFHDPVRESFEAELEEVQKLQEQRRQLMNEEQARAMEMAQREEEERIRLAREQEEQQRRLEEERLETMRRAEQEKLESMRRAEELRIAREEEKRRLNMEDERRKQAAKLKLLELEERIARRNAEGERSGNTSSSGVADEKFSGMVSEKNVSKVADVGDWEDSERMVERITTSASSDSSGMNRPFEMGSRSQFHRDGSPAFLDRGKIGNSWKRDVFENANSSTFFPQDQEYGHHSPRQDASVGGRTHSRKEFYGGSGFVPSRIYHTGGIPDSHLDDLGQSKGQRWNMSGDGDPYGRRMEIDSEFHENLTERFGDAGWPPNRSRGNPYPPNHERMYQNPEADGLYSFGRSRYSMKQPRVLPPPLNSVLRNPYRADIDGPGPSIFPERDMHYNIGPRNESSTQARYDSSHQENVGRAERIDARQEHTENVAYKMDRNLARCDSQSSLSVSSPPDSPVHLSHDDLDEFADSQALSGNEGKDVALLGKGDEHATLPIGAEKVNLMSESSVVSIGDDEEWTIENDQRLQEQEEYDEDVDGYGEEDEAHDVEDDNANLAQDFEDMHMEEKVSSDMIENLVLGFNEGVEVGMPNDEFERSSRNEETKFVAQQNSVEEQGSFEGMDGDGQAHLPGDSTKTIENSARIFQENEKALQNLVIQPKNVPQTSSASEFTVDSSSTSGLTTQLQISSSSGQTVMPGVPSVLGQPEVPVKLQFGLFSGPSLIPSPVPAIQIGSIQMPLHLHTPVGPSLTQMHPSQPHLFQFGQLRYTSPISQGILPLAPQSMSFMQPNVPNNFPLNQNGGSLTVQSGQDNASHGLIKSDYLSASMDNQSGLLPRNLNVSHGQASKQQNSLPPSGSANVTVKTQRHQGEISHMEDSNSKPESGVRARDSLGKNFRGSTRQWEGQPQNGAYQSGYKEKDITASKGRGILSGGRGKRYSFAVKNSVSKSSLQAKENFRHDSSGFHRPRRPRTEFRVRESSDKRQSAMIVSSSPHGVDDRSNISGRVTGARSISTRAVVPNRPSKQTIDSEGLHSRTIGPWEVDSGSKFEKGGGKESLRKNQGIAHSGEDVDAPLQSGVVRVFEQPGIEAPSDDDDFIEVRSKRQMLNDRREQREKEIKAKSRVLKLPRKQRSSSQSKIVSVTSDKIPLSVGAEVSNSGHSDYVSSDGHGLANVEVSAGFNSPVMSQPLPPIGTPAVKTDAQADIRSQTIKSFQPSSLPAVSGGGKNLATGLMFESKHKILDNAQASLGAWGNSRINQQVMALTQSQLDDAMKPAQVDSNSSIGDPSKSVGDSASILIKEKSFSSAASPINSLLAGEKIQFGAVTSPTILPPTSRALCHGIGPPGPCRADIQISHNLASAENDCSLFFEKEKRSNETCAHLVDCEAEAEAAASAIAVAAISSDEIVDNRIGAGPISASDSKNFSGADIDSITAGVSGDQQLSSQSRAEESLSVALPADLSVETPPISLWPPVPSPHNSSSQMLSHVPGGPASHFPFYEMNPMLGGPIFAFGPHDESASPQSQPQKSNASVSGPLGTWQHHSGVDSFYGPPAGFTGPFISPPGSIPGVQGPPHMVVYNHFAPVGQFGQVGLSFMGTTYLPSGKQPDWKHNPPSSVIGVGEGEMNSLNMVSAPRNPINMPAPIQHLAPGSPLMPMGSPLAMFDVSPFQSSPDMSVQARWSHVPSSPLQSVPVSMPLQPQAEGTLSSQFNHGPGVDQPLANRFSDSRTVASSENKNKKFPAGTDATVLPDELGLVDPSSATGGATSTQNVVARSSSASTIPDGVQNGNGNGNGSNSTNGAFKSQSSHQKSASAQHYGYGYQRGGNVSQKNSSGSEWSHRRMGYQGRNQPLGPEKNFPPSKLKQIYVAKQTATGGTSST
ncbi:uncharacterized protein [Euphorbia lathyris]|uniref:uncharacterized protein isoform X2 n=1 Tax=Euphorbia lathyris TaxID=212925 RepID=UPI003313F34C